ncbi:MAG: ABC transporter ATP-binding protein, partial [Chitinophagaceae bacterium]|nr:ABC transporter ATP-binding protein [Chitinophagaceae bacterium]
MTSDIVIHTEGLTKRYGDFIAANNISIDVH